MTPVPVPATGDPEAMRSVAREWVARAASLDELAGVVASTAGALGLEGPAATRLVDQCDAARQSAAAAAEELRTLAAELLGEATAAEEAAAAARVEAERELDEARGAGPPTQGEPAPEVPEVPDVPEAPGAPEAPPGHDRGRDGG